MFNILTITIASIVIIIFVLLLSIFLLSDIYDAAQVHYMFTNHVLPSIGEKLKWIITYDVYIECGCNSSYNYR